MSLAQRLNKMEQQLRELMEWKAGIEQALADEDAGDEEKPALTLDGDLAGGTRDQTQSLG